MVTYAGSSVLNGGSSLPYVKSIVTLHSNTSQKDRFWLKSYSLGLLIEVLVRCVQQLSQAELCLNIPYNCRKK